jgi:hypothetical protein
MFGAGTALGQLVPCLSSVPRPFQQYPVTNEEPVLLIIADSLNLSAAFSAAVYPAGALPWLLLVSMALAAARATDFARLSLEVFASTRTPISRRNNTMGIMKRIPTTVSTIV